MRRIALGIVVLFFLVNVVAGPGVPEVVGGRPALVAHTAIRFVNWNVYWLMYGLIGASFLSLAVASVAARFPQRGPSRSGALGEESSESLLREKFIGGRIEDTYYRLMMNARITRDDLELREADFFGESPPILRIPLAHLGPIWFVRGLSGWSIYGGPSPELSTFFIFPWNPRHWFEVLTQLGVPVRPVGLRASQLPRLQLALVAQFGCAAVLIVVVVGVLAFFAVLAVLALLRSLGVG